MRRAVFAEGGSGPTNKMFKPQAAGPDKPGNTGKDQTPAPGATFASGGLPEEAGYGISVPARPGTTGPGNVPRKGR